MPSCFCAYDRHSLNLYLPELRRSTKLMPRERHTDPPKEVNLSLPTSLVDEVDLLLFNPTRGKLRYGARSKLIAGLLRQWLNAQRKLPAATVEQNIADLEYSFDEPGASAAQGA